MHVSQCSSSNTLNILKWVIGFVNCNHRLWLPFYAPFLWPRLIQRDLVQHPFQWHVFLVPLGVRTYFTHKRFHFRNTRPLIQIQEQWGEMLTASYLFQSTHSISPPHNNPLPSNWKQGVSSKKHVIVIGYWDNEHDALFNGLVEQTMSNESKSGEQSKL